MLFLSQTDATPIRLSKLPGVLTRLKVEKITGSHIYKKRNELHVVSEDELHVFFISGLYGSERSLGLGLTCSLQ
jgi:ribosomal 30S subunit maturation factor RimM